MNKLDWVRDLVRAEQQLEEADMVDFSIGFDANHALQEETLKLLHNIKETFVDYCTAFNQMKGVALGNIKIYGIANTANDFMLFRNGMKLIFSQKKPGQIGIRVSVGGGFFAGQPTTESSSEEDILEAQWGAFNEIFWTHRGLRVMSTDSVVKFYLSHFIRESAK